MNNRVEQFPGVIAKGCKADNAVTICYGRSINGSGKCAFGGSKEWPCLKVEVGFQEHQADKMLCVGKQIERLLRAEGLIEPCPNAEAMCRPFNNVAGSFGGWWGV